MFLSDNNNNWSDIIPRGHTLYECDPSPLLSSQLQLCCDESDESPAALSAPLIMLPNSPLVLLFSGHLQRPREQKDTPNTASLPSSCGDVLPPVSGSLGQQRAAIMTSGCFLLLLVWQLEIKKKVFELPPLVSWHTRQASPMIVDETSKSRCWKNRGVMHVSNIHCVCCSKPLWLLTSCWQIQVFQPVVPFDPMEIRNRVLYPGNRFVARWQIKRSWDQRLRVTIPHESVHLFAPATCFDLLYH